MKIINTKVHGVLDYAMGIFLVASPWLLKFADSSAAQWVPVMLGIAMISMSLITRYELGIAKIIPMKTHLTVDIFSGILLAASPWLFGFSDRIFLPHLILGLAEIGAAIMTEPVARNVTDKSATNSAHAH